MSLPCCNWLCVASGRCKDIKVQDKTKLTNTCTSTSKLFDVYRHLEVGSIYIHFRSMDCDWIDLCLFPPGPLCYSGRPVVAVKSRPSSCIAATAKQGRPPSIGQRLAQIPACILVRNVVIKHARTRTHTGAH